MPIVKAPFLVVKFIFRHPANRRIRQKTIATNCSGYLFALFWLFFGAKTGEKAKTSSFHHFILL
jgi:hypothetical protein